MCRNKKLLYLLFLAYSGTSAYSQLIKLPDYSIETDAVLSSGKQTPFWLMSNQYGLVTAHKDNYRIRLGMKAGEEGNQLTRQLEKCPGTSVIL